MEASERLEHFQWLTEEQSRQLPPDAFDAVKTEVADVLLYLIRIGDKLDIDIISVANAKNDPECGEVPGGKGAGHE